MYAESEVSLLSAGVEVGGLVGCDNKSDDADRSWT